MKRGKKAQFYLIAAVIIVAILIGLASLTNYITINKKPARFYDLSSELDEEGARVVDYGIYNEENVPERIENFTEEYFVYYSEKKERGSELVFIYGDRENVTVSTYSTENTGTVSVDYGTSSFELSGEDKYVSNKTSFIPSSTEDFLVKVRVLGVDYDFNLKEGENFFFIINKNTTEERYIVGNSQKG